MSENVELLTPAQVAAWLHVSKSTLARWRQSGCGPRCIWLSAGIPRYRVEDVRQWIGEHVA